MTFAPDFAFYRDDRPLDRSPPEDFWDAIREEALALYTQRQTTYPGMVLKGRMKREDADRELRVALAIARDFNPRMFDDDRPGATWSEMIHALRREITLRRKMWPARVEAGLYTAADVDRRILLLETWHDVLWHFSRRPEAVEARAAAARAQALRHAA